MISIIALLVAILLPALQRARQMGQAVVCANLERQWAVACTFYTMDYDDFWPVAYDARKVVWKVSDPSTEQTGEDYYRRIWYNVLTPYLEKARGSVLEVNEQNLKSGLRDCASRKARIGVIYGGGWNRQTGVAPLSLFVAAGDPTRDPYKITWAQFPSEWITLIDVQPGTHMMYHPLWASTSPETGFDTDTDGDGVLDSCSSLLASNELPWNCAMPKVHGDGCNVGMADGHVESLRFMKFMDMRNGLWLD